MKQTIIVFWGLLIVSCNSSNLSKKAVQSEEISFQLPDSLFAFHDIKNTLIINDFWFDRNDYEYYSDSIQKRPFIKLDTIQLRKWIAPIFALNVDYVTGYMESRFVSKQKIIDGFTPIVVWVTGDDYGALFYILLDKNYNAISYFKLSGGECGGPDYVSDTLIELCPLRHSFIEEKKIRTYSLTEIIRTSEKGKEASIFDSVNYVSEILTTGKIQTKQIDSTRYERVSENSNIFLKENK